MFDSWTKVQIKNNKSWSKYSIDNRRVLDPYHAIFNMIEDNPLMSSPASLPQKRTNLWLLDRELGRKHGLPGYVMIKTQPKWTQEHHWLSLHTLAILQNNFLSCAICDKPIAWTLMAIRSFTTDVRTVSVLLVLCKGLETQHEDKKDLSLSSHHYLFNKQVNKNISFWALTGSIITFVSTNSLLP